MPATVPPRCPVRPRPSSSFLCARSVPPAGAEECPEHTPRPLSWGSLPGVGVHTPRLNRALTGCATTPGPQFVFIVLRLSDCHSSRSHPALRLRQLLSTRKEAVRLQVGGVCRLPTLPYKAGYALYLARVCGLSKEIPKANRPCAWPLLHRRSSLLWRHLRARSQVQISSLSLEQPHRTMHL